jgi:hypothetical protein
MEQSALDASSPLEPGASAMPLRASAREHMKAGAGNWSRMTEPANEPEPVHPGEDPGVDPPPDDGENAVDGAQRLDEPDREEKPDPLTWIGSDVP